MTEELLFFVDKKKLYQQQLKKDAIDCQMQDIYSFRCKQTLSKYICPKCKINYCSLNCYRGHSNACVEKFDLESEKDRYRGIKASFDDEMAMKKTLGRMSREMREEPIIPINEDEQIERLEELYSQCEIGALDINKLTLEEQKEFGQFIQEMEEEESWQPWWEVEEGVFSLYVEDQQKNDLSSNQYTEFRMKLKEKLKTIMPIQINVYSICVASRALNGDIIELNLEFYEIMIQICYSLSNQAREIGSQDIALQKVKEQSQYDKQLLSPYLELDDLQKVMSSKFYVIETLFQFYDVLHSLTDKQSKNIEDEYRLEEIKNIIFYFLCNGSKN
ncbi:hypothetical protein pb186bvf_001706 [Paramecium bursaria]